MGYHPRIESSEFASFITTRTRNSELWFINNPELDHAILGYLAKFSNRYQVKLYAFAIAGNHIHSQAHFPGANRARFMQDLNACVAKAVPRHTPEYPGGRLWGRRYSNEFFIADEDLEEKFFYIVLQAVQDGLARRISEYPGYNCFHDAVHGVKRRYKVVNWAAYNAARRRNERVAIKDYTEVVELEYARLPGYDHLSQKEYAKMMHEKLEARRQAILADRASKGLTGVMGRNALLQQRRGSVPFRTKVSDINTLRPRILSGSPERRRAGYAWYYAIQREYRSASIAYRQGRLQVEFPQGTFRPILHN